MLVEHIDYLRVRDLLHGFEVELRVISDLVSNLRIERAHIYDYPGLPPCSSLK